VLKAKIISSKLGPQNGSFISGKWTLNVTFWFYGPKEAHPCEKLRLLTSKSVRTSTHLGSGRETKKGEMTDEVRPL